MSDTLLIQVNRNTAHASLLCQLQRRHVGIRYVLPGGWNTLNICRSEAQRNRGTRRSNDLATITIISFIRQYFIYNQTVHRVQQSKSKEQKPNYYIVAK